MEGPPPEPTSLATHTPSPVIYLLPYLCYGSLAVSSSRSHDPAQDCCPFTPWRMCLTSRPVWVRAEGTRAAGKWRGREQALWSPLCSPQATQANLIQSSPHQSCLCNPTFKPHPQNEPSQPGEVAQLWLQLQVQSQSQS